MPLQIEDLGRLQYAAALDHQRRVHDAVVAGDQPATIILVEHDSVITISRRPGADRHLLADRATLSRLGIAVCETDRGGDITYHGPGQLVAYPILPLTPLGLNITRYMRLLEQIIINTVATFGITAVRIDGCTGVWSPPQGAKLETRSSKLEFGVAVADAGIGSIAEGSNSNFELRTSSSHAAPACLVAPMAKLAALGVRVRKMVTMHGLALNVTTDLTHFQTIVPCGLADRPVTSMHALLGESCPDMATVKAELVKRFRDAVEGKIG